MGETIQQTARMLRDRRVKSEMETRLGLRNYQQLDLWLKDVAAGNMSTGDWWSTINQKARANATIAYMALSTTTIMSQPAGLTNSITGLGGGMKGLAALGVGMGRYVSAIKRGNLRETMDWIHDKSTFMRERTASMHRDINEAHQLWRQNPVDTNTYRRAIMAPIGAVQKYAVDIPTWLAAYEQARAAGKDEKLSAFQADQIVKNYQSSGLSQDLSGILRGTVNSKVRQSALMKSITLAYNYFNNKLNRVYVTVKTKKAGPAGNYAMIRDTIALVWLDALMADLILQRLPGLIGGDDDDDDSLMKSWGWWIMRQPAAMFVGFRDLASGLQGYDAATPVSALIKSVGNLATQLKQGEPDKALLKAGIMAAGLGTGMVPAVEANRVVELIDRIREGDDLEYKDFVRGRTRAEK